MKLRAVLILMLLLADCATVPAGQDASQFFNDSLFAAPSASVSTGDIFAMNDDMRAYMIGHIGPQMHGGDTRRALFEALYSSKQLKLEYDSSMTRNAAQAFAAKSGNCLSLVILTAAFAHQLGLPVQYQSVFSSQTVSRKDDIIYVSGHVNLSLEQHETGGRVKNSTETPMTIDFLPPRDTAGQHVRVVREATIIAMYMNNRAAETLGEGHIDDAYHWARHAIVQDPTFLTAYNTLAVVYMRHGDLPQAERILKYIVGLAPGDPSPISNLVVVLGRLGRQDEANRWNETLKKIQLNPPFYYFDIGMKAMQDKDYAKARDMFAKEVEREAYYHEFHAWLGAAYYALGDYDQARKQLALAIANSTTTAERDLYTARLRSMTSQQVLTPSR